MMALAFLLAQAATEAPATPASKVDLLLSCEGTTAGNSWLGGLRGARKFTVQMRLNQTNPAMQIPPDGAGFVPDQWFNIKDMQFADATITGTVKMGLIRVHFVVDRRAGTISTDDGFSGTCRKIDPDQRAF